MPESERDDLVPELHARKTDILSELVDRGEVEVRPGARRLLDELTDAGCALAVATTGSRGWVDRLLDRLLPGVEFTAVVTGDDVSERKPDPEAFTLALERLGVEPGQAVIVEDSGEGLAAARAAGVACVVVVNGYTAGHHLEAADLVLDGFGEPHAPAAVVGDVADTGCAGVLDLAVLRRLCGTGRNRGARASSG